MNKRREAFLAKNPFLKRFTKNSIVKNFGVSSEEFDALIREGFIEENNDNVCANCLRRWENESEECKYCGEEEYVKEKGFYSYKK